MTFRGIPLLTLLALTQSACSGTEQARDLGPDAPNDQDAAPAPFTEHLTANINGTPFAAQLIAGEPVVAALRGRSPTPPKRSKLASSSTRWR